MARKLKSDKLLFTSTLVLVCASLVMVYSASAVIGMEEYDERPTYFLSKQATFAPLGLALMPLLMRVDYRHYRQPAVIWTALAMVAIALVGVLFGPRINGARRWFAIAGIGVQPSEFAKIVVIFFVAAILERRMDRIDDLHYSLVPVAIVLGAVGGLVMLQPDLGTALSIIVIVSPMFFAAGITYPSILGLLLASRPAPHFSLITPDHPRPP